MLYSPSLVLEYPVKPGRRVASVPVPSLEQDCIIASYGHNHILTLDQGKLIENILWNRSPDTVPNLLKFNYGCHTRIYVSGYTYSFNPDSTYARFLALDPQAAMKPAAN